MVIIYNSVWSNPVRLQVSILPDAGKINFPLSPFGPENLVSRNRFGRPVPRQRCSFSTLRLNLVLAYGILLAFRDGVHLFIPSTTIGSVPRLSGHAIAYRWRSLPRVRRHSAVCPQDSWSNGCCIFRYHHGPFFVRLSSLTPTIGV